MQPKTFFLIHGRSCHCFIKKVLENTKILNWSTKDGTFCQSVTPIHRKQSCVANIWWGHETNIRWLWWDARCSVWKVLRFLNQWEHFIPTISPHPPHGHLGKKYVFFISSLTSFGQVLWVKKLRKHVRDILKKLISEHLVGLLVKQVIWPVIL